MFSFPVRDLSLTNLSVQKNVATYTVTANDIHTRTLEAEDRVTTQTLVANEVVANIINMPYAFIPLPFMGSTFTILHEDTPGAGATFGLSYPDGDSGQGFPVYSLAQSVGSGYPPLYVSVMATWTVWVPASNVQKKIRLSTDYPFYIPDPDSTFVINVQVNDLILTINASSAVGEDPSTAPYMFLYETNLFDWPVDDIMTVSVYGSGNPPAGSYIRLFDHVIIM